MARLARAEVAGFPHHVLQRGHNRQAIFVDADDHRHFLTLLQAAAAAQSVAVHAYVLMTNHFHLVVTPDREGGLGRFMQALGRRYVRWFNDRHARTGTLWDGRFRSTVLDPQRHLLACMRYVELNPVRAGISATADEYRWSSNAHHVGTRVDPVIADPAVFWALGNTPFERQSAYRSALEEPLPPEFMNEIRQATNRGYALAHFDPASGLDGDAASRTPLRRPRGRPRKQSPT